MDDSKAFHGKLLFNQTSFENWLFGLPCLVNFRSDLYRLSMKCHRDTRPPREYQQNCQIDCFGDCFGIAKTRSLKNVDLQLWSWKNVKNEKRQTGSNLHDGEGWQRNSSMQTRCFGNWLMSLKLAAWQNSSIFVFHARRKHHCVSFFPILNVHEALHQYPLSSAEVQRTLRPLGKATWII